MKDDMIAIFGLKASGKGKEAQGNNLYAVDSIYHYMESTAKVPIKVGYWLL